MKLQYKITLSIFVILLVIGLIGAAFLLQFQRQTAISQFEESALTIAGALYGSIERRMLDASQERIQDAVTSIASRCPEGQLINEVVVYSMTQKVYASGDSSEIGKTRNDEEIARVLATGETTTRTGDYYGEEHLCVILPVTNKPECYGCHSPEEKILGAIDIGLDKGSLENQIRDQTLVLALIGGITFSSLGIALFLTLRREITNPLSKLAAAAQRISQGDFSARAEVKTGDEVGIVARTFNEMAQQVEEALRRSSEFSETVMSSIDDGICIINVDDYRIEGVNNAFLEQLGWEEEEVIGRACYQIMYHRSEPCTGQDFRCLLLDTVRSGRSSAADHEIYRSNGEKLYVDVSTSPVKDKNGNVIQVVHASRDITERKQAEEREKQLQHELNLSTRLASIGELSAGVAHEINNPLTGIIGFSQRLLRKSTDEEFSRGLERIHSEAQRAARVVENLRTFARRSEPEKERCNIGEILARTLELRAYELKHSNIELEVNLDPNLPPVMADFQQLQQVFLNIVLNAEQAMIETNSRGKLVLKTEKVKDYARISFVNDGPEIPAEQIDKLFDPFYTTRGDKGGTGLGLSVCHGIVEEHNGRIYAESKPGKDTTFFVELPLAPEEIGESKVTEEEPVRWE
ncbi:ATP-binding protein [Chloroflexota bacterium]